MRRCRMPMAIHLLVRIIVKAYAAGLKCGSKEGTQHQLHMPTLHGMLLNNVNILVNEAPLKGDPEDPVALFKEACKNEEENINVLFIERYHERAGRGISFPSNYTGTKVTALQLGNKRTTRVMQAHNS